MVSAKREFLSKFPNNIYLCIHKVNLQSIYLFIHSSLLNLFFDICFFLNYMYTTEESKYITEEQMLQQLYDVFPLTNFVSWLTNFVNKPDLSLRMPLSVAARQ